jgi:hypothetical protein
MAKKSTGLDRAVEYTKKLEQFRKAFEDGHNARMKLIGPNLKPERVEVETGRKFDKVFVNTGHQRLGRYMVDRNSWAIFGIKSWAQVNDRRQYGTLDTVDQYDWQPHYGVPKAGTQAEKDFLAREAEIQKEYKPRGRPRKQVV